MPYDKRRVGTPTVHSLIVHRLVHVPDSDDQKKWIEFTARSATFQIRVRSDGVYLIRQILPDLNPTRWIRWTPDLDDFTSNGRLISAERLPS